jgi:hypothetical protein
MPAAPSEQVEIFWFAMRSRGNARDGGCANRGHFARPIAGRYKESSISLPNRLFSKAYSDNHRHRYQKYY